MEGDDDKILYVGVDMESIDNNCSMSMEPIINMGFSAAFADGVELASLSVNLIPGTPGDPDTLTWFKEKNLEAYEASTKDPVPPRRRNENHSVVVQCASASERRHIGVLSNHL